jgi:asparagine synthase (glutamine-hydrolysing)
VCGEVEKYALREAARPFHTDTVYRRQKHPLFAPFELKGRMRELALDTLRPERIASLPFFEPRAVARFVASPPSVSHGAARSSYFGLMLTLTSLCVLSERYGL